MKEIQIEIEKIETQGKLSKAQSIPMGIYSDEVSPVIKKLIIFVLKVFFLR